MYEDESFCYDCHGLEDAYLCDGKFDCVDRSDESHCGKHREKCPGPEEIWSWDLEAMRKFCDSDADCGSQDEVNKIAFCSNSTFWRSQPCPFPGVSLLQANLFYNLIL